MNYVRMCMFVGMNLYALVGVYESMFNESLLLGYYHFTLL